MKITDYRGRITFFDASDPNRKSDGIVRDMRKVILASTPTMTKIGVDVRYVHQRVISDYQLVFLKSGTGWSGTVSSTDLGITNSIIRGLSVTETDLGVSIKGTWLEGGVCYPFTIDGSVIQNRESDDDTA